LRRNIWHDTIHFDRTSVDEEEYPVSFPVIVEPSNGQFAAALVGAPNVRVVGSTPDEALTALRGEIQQRMARGELVSLEVAPLGVSGLAGTFADDPTLRDVCDEAYRIRDAEREE
jgi:hypothetical protein